MKVLSLFDGMSCGRIALDRAGIEVTSYHASELDKYAIQVTQANWPETVQLGDVTGWRDWDIDWKGIDLLIGGSPCQGFSFAGKQLAFDDPRSKLFFVYVDILNHIKTLNPNVKFMLENVRMKKEYLDVISRVLGVEPVFINSALVSAQNRQRFYWANWKIEQPEDKGILLAGILEVEGFGVIKSHGELKPKNDKSQCIDANYHKGADNHGQRTMINPSAIVGRKLDENGKRNDKLESKPVQCLEVHEHGKSRCLSTVAKDTVVMKLTNYPLINLNESTCTERCKKQIKKNSKMPHQKSVAVCTNSNMTGSGSNVITSDNLSYRKLTPIECERLQTVPDNYTNHASNTQRYKMLGNGWTVDVIAHVFKQGLINYER